MNVGERIKKYRTGKMSRDELAEKLGVGHSSIANYEQNTREPNFERLEKISDILGISLKELLFDEPENIGIEYKLKELSKLKRLIRKDIGKELNTCGKSIFYLKNNKRVPIVKTVTSGIVSSENKERMDSMSIEDEIKALNEKFCNLNKKTQIEREEYQNKLKEIGDIPIETKPFIDVDKYDTEIAERTLKDITDMFKIASVFQDKLVKRLLISESSFKIGEIIKQLRLEKGLTQKKLAEMTNISEISIRKYENGERKPKIEVLQKLADALEISLNQLMENEKKEYFLGLGETIKKLRKYEKLTQIQLANKVGIGVASIQRYERNELQPNIETLKNIAKALNVSINVLTGATEFISKSLEDYSTDELLEEIKKRMLKGENNNGNTF